MKYASSFSYHCGFVVPFSRVSVFKGLWKCDFRQLRNRTQFKEHALTTSYKNMFYQRNQGSKTVNSNLYTYASWLKGSEKKPFKWKSMFQSSLILVVFIQVIFTLRILISHYIHFFKIFSPVYRFRII